MDRRRFTTNGLALLGLGMGVPGLGHLGRAAASAEGEAHFFVQILIPGGLDPHYLFDARPRALHGAKRQAFYHSDAPTKYTGKQGGSLLKTSLTEPLNPWLERMSIINGVHMAASFDGHPQNINFLLTGSPFGGEYFAPHLNVKQTPLDYLLTGPGNLSADLTNTNGGVPLKFKGAVGLASSLATMPPISADRLTDHLTARMQQGAKGRGGFSRASQQMLSSFQNVDPLRAMLGQLQLPANEESLAEPTTREAAQLVSEVFRIGAATNALLVLDGDGLDCHSLDAAQQLPTTIRATVESIAIFLKTLDQTQYDEHSSIAEHTTIMISSEFGRTLHQPAVPFEKSATDHNPFANTFMLLGKGITPGLVIGESDLQSPEAFEAVSPVHAQKDPQLIKAMGRPFDFASGKVRGDQPANYAPTDYITCDSVINTIYSLMGVAPEQWRELGRGLGIAPVLDSVLK